MAQNKTNLLNNTALSPHPTVLLLLSALAVCLCSLQLPFFWDGLLVSSRCATYFYEHGPGNGLLPTRLDSGHPPLFAWYIAACWQFFGRTLPVSHLAMLPFIAGTLYQIALLCRRFVSGALTVFAFLLLASDPTLSAQLLQVNFDIPLVFFTLTAFNALLSKRLLLQALAMVFIGLINLRGCLYLAALGIIQTTLLFQGPEKPKPKTLLQVASTFLPALVVFGLWFGYHYRHTGWYFYNLASEWGGGRGKTDLIGFFRNAVITAWRLLDYGRIGVWLLLTACLPVLYKNLRNRNVQVLLLLLLVPLLVQAAVMWPKNNPIAHRYFMLSYLAAGMLAATGIDMLKIHSARKKGLFVLLIAFQITGNLWVYPDTVAKGWDASLAFISFPRPLKEMRQYLHQRRIPFSKVATGFPLKYSGDEFFLDNDTAKFSSFSKLNHPYFLYSNLTNDFTDSQLDSLKTWPAEQSASSGEVRFKLYRNPAYRTGR